MRFDVVTLFPEMFSAITQAGVTARAYDQRVWSLKTWNPRDFTDDAYHRVDDRPFGGGPGMVMLAEPLARAIDAARQDGDPGSARVVLMSPQGTRLDNAGVVRMAANAARLIVVCGRYEAVDERLVQTMIDDEISIGDFVMSGGEIPAMAMIDAVVRQLPGALGDAQSAALESFSDEASGLLDCPHWTRPESWRGESVPSVLLSGHHANIAQWRRDRSLESTAKKRPDLLQRARSEGRLSQRDEKFLEALPLSARH